MRTFLERYLAGEHEQVRADLVELGPDVCQPTALPDATAVARETMQRAQNNIVALIAQLRVMG
ncbi:hypothetical protein [Deinococcus navajonensis]|uniref:Uncharacterized protein n=1 Tax=Deinococcus navajonensis TaxID=309884 RepID=A0ABV8XKW9_9DEIO